MVNMHKILSASLLGIMASHKANLEDRDVSESDLTEAHALLTRASFVLLLPPNATEKKEP